MPTKFDYAAFIDELGGLVARARGFRADERSLAGDSFRRWLHETVDLIHRVNRLRYDVNCGIEGRSFQVMSYGSVSKREQQEKFDRDLEDTLAELDLVIDRFRKYGDPREKSGPSGQVAIPVESKSVGPEPLVAPEKVTISWLFSNVPVTWFVTLAASYCIVFGVGMTAASTKLGKAIVEWVTPAKSPAQ